MADINEVSLVMKGMALQAKAKSQKEMVNLLSQIRDELMKLNTSIEKLNKDVDDVKRRVGGSWE